MRPLTPPEQKRVADNMGLVWRQAYKWHPVCGHLTIEDLVQEGTIGLMRAVQGFDETRGLQLSTYAGYWIKHFMRRAIQDHKSDVREPIYRQEERTQGRARAKWQHSLSVPVFLDAPLSEVEDERSLHEILGAFLRDPGEELDQEGRRQEVRAALRVLNEREVHILRQRYGLDDDQERKLGEVGKPMGLCRERIRQIENQALAKMRKVLAP